MTNISKHQTDCLNHMLKLTSTAQNKSLSSIRTDLPSVTVPSLNRLPAPLRFVRVSLHGWPHVIMWHLNSQTGSLLVPLENDIGGRILGRFLCDHLLPCDCPSCPSGSRVEAECACKRMTTLNRHTIRRSLIRQQIWMGMCQSVPWRFV